MHTTDLMGGVHVTECTDDDINVTAKPETVSGFTAMYAEKREFLEHLQKFGNSFERAAASVVIDVATASNSEVEACR